jgi:hypothetical protein
MLARGGGVTVNVTVTVTDTAPAHRVHFSFNVAGMYTFNIGSVYSAPENTPHS